MLESFISHQSSQTHQTVASATPPSQLECYKLMPLTIMKNSSFVTLVRCGIVSGVNGVVLPVELLILVLN